MKIISKGYFSTIQQFHLFDQKKLGNGSFGIVKLALHMSTNKLYAIKIINLQDIPSQIEAKLIERQIKLQSQINHPHIIKLWDTLIDDKNIYMILEYAQKGNLFYYQNSKNKFSQPQAFVFFSQTVKAVQNLHNNNVIHRDLKPENLLLDQFYNVKICDFGWCAQNIHLKRATFCGTYQYMAPQMIFNSHYDYRVDIWALGILLYEMTHGYAPFKGESVNQVKEKMLKCSYSLDQSLSQNLKDLIISLLKFNPSQRVALNKLLNHSWFQKMEILISTTIIQSKLYEATKIHQLICKIPNQTFVKSVDSKHYFTNKMNFQGKTLSNSFNSKNQVQKNISKTIDDQYSKLFQKQGKNININFSINNFSYIQDQKSERKNMFSPAQAFSRKKNKSFYKRISSQTSQQSTLNSAYKKNKKSKSKEKQSLSNKKSEKHSKLSQKINQKSIRKVNEKNSNELTSLVMQKIVANLKRHAIKDKNNPFHSPSIKNIKNAKSKSRQKMSFNQFSYL